VRLRLLALVLLTVAALALPAAARADGITATCAAGGVTGACSSGWYRSNVTVSFILPAGSSNPQGCGDQTVNSDTTGATFTCTVAVAGTQCCRLDVTIKRDATPPTASAIAAARGADVNGWYNHPVAIAVSGSDATSGIASCTNVTYAGPDSGSASVSGTCTDNAGNVSTAQVLSFKYDATAPSVSATPSRSPDSNGWYNHGVDVSFKGSDATSGIDSCTAGSYSGPDSASAGVTGSCRDAAGNTGSATFALQYDATPPAVTGAAADRQPDVNGWYNHAVVVTFSGSDATSGIASCDAVTYSKPDDPNAQVTGRCHDNAGNVSAPGSAQLKYDSTPPKLTELTASAADRGVSLKWKDSKDVAQLTLSRVAGKTSATVYNGRPIDTFADKRLRNGVRYTYSVTATDAAGNRVTAKVATTPAPPLTAHVRNGVTLHWRAVPKASYYNVQVWLKGVKVLTTWPAGASLRIAHLPRGRYVWHVWPGFGALSKHRFGPLIGTSSFVVSR
jgi:hypothetical protein